MTTSSKKGGFANHINMEEARLRGQKKSSREATVRLSVPLNPEFHATFKAAAAMNRTTMEAATVQALTTWLAQNRK